MIVVDTNVVAYLLIAGSKTALARQARRRDADWRVPWLWRAEFLNVLATAVRASVLTRPQAHTAWSTAQRLLDGAAVEPSSERVLLRALDLGVTAYDAQFLVVAEELGVPLVTADTKLARAGRGTAVALAAFAA